ncbi:MAG: hypothetical protein GYA34_01025 [Chloroflexi bacterium]|nr:hypothetical protein [Chloroflexota bacterium]
MLLSPLETFINLVALIVLGLFCLGLISMTATLAARHNVVGFLAGAGVLLSGYIGTHFAGSVTSWWIYFLITHHFELTPGVFPIRNIPLLISILYWVIGALLLILAGLTLVKQQDFIAVEA